jgi:hypothetical protein
MVTTAKASNSDVMNNGQCGKAGDRIEMNNDATIPTQQNTHHTKPHHGLFYSPVAITRTLLITAY